ncbi:hypothetical protein GCM10017788_65490 [Amycolatopsis acidiphila]|nr:hypothetical protein GCM10017788_65490 [Amycolatopsis acidiphila]
MVVTETAAIKVTTKMPLDRAALIGCAVTTGIGAVLNTAKVGVGESVAVFGCGGVGLNAIQGAALAGAHPVIAVDIEDSKLEVAREMGATITINSANVDAVDAVRGNTSGGVDYAVLTVGIISVLEQALAALRVAGTCVLVGAPAQGQLAKVDPLHLLAGERRLVGSRYGSYNPQIAFPRLVDLYLSGKIKLDNLISHRYELDQVNEASRNLVSGHDVRGMILFD